MRKRIAATIISVALVYLFAANVSANEGSSHQEAGGYKDVAADAWYAGHIRDVTAYGLFQGTKDGYFLPEKQIARAEFVTVLGRMYEQEHQTIDEVPDGFTDTEYPSFYGKYVAWACAEGIIRGCGNNLFAPCDAVTKEQMAAILYNYVTHLELDIQREPQNIMEFNDFGQISPGFFRPITYMQQFGIITGDAKGYYHPQKGATRAEASKVFAELYSTIYIRTFLLTVN